MENQMKLRRVVWTVIGAVSLLATGACKTAPESKAGKADIEKEAAAAVTKARMSNASLAGVLDGSAGYAAFPSVGKGAVGVGGAYGKGVLFERGSAGGYCDLSQASIGLALGGQTDTEILVFETRDAVDNFKKGRLHFDAQATAVAIKSGVGVNAKFTNGVAVYTMDEAGLMYEASVGGQKFSYQAK
jgi:lipid-binding SYLF domain-containing protein